jgi:excisionase family DNA binding protein
MENANLPARKDTIMSRKANTPQPMESLQLNGVKKLLKVEDVADILGVSRVKVYLLLRNGLPSVKIDGARRFQPDKVQAWIEQHSA